MPPAPGGEAKKGGLEPDRRGAGAEQGRLLHQGPPRVRRARASTLGACDGRAAQEAPELGALPDGSIRVGRPAGKPGRPRKRPGRPLADRGHAHDSCRALLRRRGTPRVIPERRDQEEERRRRRGGRPPLFDAEAYRGRNVVERCVNRLEQWRGVATRLREAGGRLPGDGPHRVADDLADDVAARHPLASRYRRRVRGSCPAPPTPGP